MDIAIGSAQSARLCGLACGPCAVNPTASSGLWTTTDRARKKRLAYRTTHLNRAIAAFAGIQRFSVISHRRMSEPSRFGSVEELRLAAALSAIKARVPGAWSGRPNNRHVLPTGCSPHVVESGMVNSTIFAGLGAGGSRPICTRRRQRFARVCRPIGGLGPLVSFEHGGFDAGRSITSTPLVQGPNDGLLELKIARNGFFSSSWIFGRTSPNRSFSYGFNRSTVGAKWTVRATTSTWRPVRSKNVTGGAMAQFADGLHRLNGRG